MPDLTDAESRFFETGELPPELADQHTIDITPPAVEPPPAAAPVTPAAAPDALTALQRQLIDAESRRLAAEQRLNDVMAQLQAAATQVNQGAVPDPATDPFGHLQHQVSQIGNAVQNLNASIAQQDQNNTLNAHLQGFVEQVRSMRDAFTKTTPDFADAYKHVREMRSNDLRDAGVPEAMLPAALLQDEMTLAQTALQSGRNPAQVIYDMAKRHGYAGKAPPPPPSTSTKLAQLQAGQEAARTLPRAGIESTLAPETLKDASDADLNKLVQSDDMWQKVMGGHTTGKNIF